MKFRSLIPAAILIAITPAGAKQDWTKTSLPALNWTSVASSSDGTRLVAVANNTFEGSVYTSQDSGQTWVQTSAPAKQWTAAASSADGMKLIIAGYDDFEGPVYVSPDAGTTWTLSAAPVTGYTSAASSADGTRLILGADVFPDSSLYTSSDSGQTWTTAPVPFSAWTSVASSANGLRLIGVSSSFPDGPVYTSANGGQNWTKSNVIASSWMSVACSADGIKCLMASNAFPTGPVYRSTNAGASWTPVTPVALSPNNWSAVASSANGTRLMVASALINGLRGESYVSPDSGVTWRSSGLPLLEWSSLAMSADGRQIVAAARGDGVYILHAFEPDIAVEQPAETALADGEARNFGPVNPGSTAEMEFTVTNTGGITLTGLNITLEGPDAGQFAVVSNPLAPIPITGQSSFTIRHSPTTAGPKIATLHLASNAPGALNPFDIQLKAEATRVDLAFHPAPSYLVSSLATQADGKLLVGGEFSTIGGGSRRGIARLNPDGSLDAGFVPPPLGFYDRIDAIAVQPDGKIVVGGFFEFVGVVGYEYLYLMRLNPDGSRDTGFVPPGPNGSISCLAIQPDGKILIGGAFVARLNPDGSLDPGFSASPNGHVHTLALLPDGRILIGGNFNAVPNGVPYPLMARLNSSGSLDPAFKPFPFISSYLDYVSSIIVQPDGKCIAGGSFGQTLEVPRRNVARFHPDGTLDADFNPDADGAVNDMVLQADGKIVMGGRFTHVGGVSRNRLARLQPDGSVEDLNEYVFGEVEALGIQADGKILIGGGFESLDGAARKNLVRLENEAAIDSLEVTGPSTLRWVRGGSAPEISDASLEILSAASPVWTPQRAGQRIAGGWEFSGLTLPASGGVRVRGRISGGAGSAGLTQIILALGSPPPGIAVEQPEGNLLVNGVSNVFFGTVFDTADSRTLTFTIRNPGSTPLGSFTATISGPQASDFTITAQPANFVAPFESTSLTVRYSPTAPGDGAATLNLAHGVPGAGPFTLAFAGRLHYDLYPHFATPADVPVVRNGFSTDGRTFGTLTLGFAPEPGAVLTVIDNTGTSAISGRFSDLPDGGLVSAAFAGQSYTFIAGYAGGTGNDLVLTAMGRGALDPSFVRSSLQVEPRCMAIQADGKILVYSGGLIRLNPDASRDIGFSPQVSSTVACIAVQPDGKVIIGGYFLTVNGVSRNYIARLKVDGSLDSGFNASANGNVFAVAIQPDGKILLGGLFNRVGGAVRYRIARVHPDGTLDAAFDPNANERVLSLAVQTDGKILVGGRFSSVGLQSAARLVRLHADGSRDADFLTDVSGGDVLSLAVAADGSIIAGGSFAGNLRRLAADGTPGLPLPAANGQVETIALQADGKILAGGGFTLLGGVPRSGVARFNQDGSVDAGFNAHANDRVGALVLQGDGRILLSGSFSTVGGVASGALVRLLNDPATSTLELISGSTARWLRNGSCPEVTQAAFEVMSPGAPDWTLLGEGRRIAGGWELDGLTLPAGSEIRALGRAGGSLIASVTSLTGPPTPLQQWRQDHFGSPLNAGAGADLADPDFDRLPNLAEYAFGLNPARPDSGAAPQIRLAGGEIVVTFATPAGVSGLTYGAEHSGTLLPGSWLAIPDTGTGGQHRFSLPVNGGKQFLRLKVSTP